VASPDSAPLTTVQLGSTDMQITRIGFGAWSIGGDWRYGWGEQGEDESMAAIERALELGINWIDTAPVYGYGQSERVIGKVLEGVERKPLLFSKASLIEGPGGEPVPCLKRDSVRREIEGTLERLGVSCIDLYQVHSPEAEGELEEGWATFRELLDEGLVRHIGVSNFDVAQMRRVASIASIETLQPRYSLIDREAEGEILPFCEREGIGVIAYSPMGSGMLTGRMSRERIEALPESDWRRSAPEFREPDLAGNLAQADRASEVAADLGVAPGVVAIGWVLRNPAVDGAIVGFRRPDQVDDLIAAAEFALGDADAARLEQIRR
jgi:aryl-alcohol dehydrogenase-like predicted oxidoreductase